MSSEFTEAIVSCAAALAVKTIVVNLLCVRARLMSKTFNFHQEKSNPLGQIFLPALFPGIPVGGSKEAVDVLERTSLNNAVNEPTFLCLALAGTLTPVAPPAVLVSSAGAAKFDDARTRRLSFFLSTTLKGCPAVSVGCFLSLFYSLHSTVSAHVELSYGTHDDCANH